MYHDVFISYSTHDKYIADAICSKLENNNIRCWIAPRDILPGVEFGEAIVNAIEDCRIVLLVFSAKANDSPQVRKEVERAISKGKIILPFRVENVLPTKSMEYALSNTHWLNAITPPLESHIDKLLEIIHRLLNIQSHGAPLKSQYENTNRSSKESAPYVSNESPNAVVKIKSVSDVKQKSQLGGTKEQEKISCTLFCKDSIRVSETIFLQVFVHEFNKAIEALSMAIEFDKSTSRRQTKVLDGVIEFNSVLCFELEIQDLVIDEPFQYLTWKGITDSIQYIVNLPSNYGKSLLIGKIKVTRNDMPIGHFSFKVEIADSVLPENIGSSNLTQMEITEYKHAFISYASKDRDEVLRRIQMLDLLKISYFQDIINLRAGDLWSDVIYKQIDAADLFLLFWSSSARNSEWVMKEVNYALKRKGVNSENPPEIYPVIIEGPPIIEPPESLKHIHFNDKIAYYIQSLNNPNKENTKQDSGQMLKDNSLDKPKTQPVHNFSENELMSPDTYRIDIICQSGETIENVILSCGPRGWSSYVASVQYTKDFELIKNSKYSPKSDRFLRFDKLSRIDFIPMNEEERAEIEKNPAYHNHILKMKITYTDGIIMDNAYLLDYCIFKTPYETGKLQTINPLTVKFRFRD
jgi:hypothetical protein